MAARRVQSDSAAFGLQAHMSAMPCRSICVRDVTGSAAVTTEVAGAVTLADDDAVTLPGAALLPAEVTPLTVPMTPSSGKRGVLTPRDTLLDRVDDGCSWCTDTGRTAATNSSPLAYPRRVDGKLVGDSNCRQKQVEDENPDMSTTGS